MNVKIKKEDFEFLIRMLYAGSTIVTEGVAKEYVKAKYDQILGDVSTQYLAMKQSAEPDEISNRDLEALRENVLGELEEDFVCAETNAYYEKLAEKIADMSYPASECAKNESIALKNMLAQEEYRRLFRRCGDRTVRIVAPRIGAKIEETV